MVRCDKLQIIARVLDCMNRYPNCSVSRQFSLTNVNMGKGYTLCKSLEQKGFLRISFTGKHYNYHITNKGLELLKLINNCYAFLENKSAIGVMQFA